LTALGLAGGIPSEPVACVTNEIAVPARPADRCYAPEVADNTISHEHAESIMEWLAERFDRPKCPKCPASAIEGAADAAPKRWKANSGSPPLP
jgi:hypothetical protein